MWNFLFVPLCLCVKHVFTCIYSGETQSILTVKVNVNMHLGRASFEEIFYPIDVSLSIRLPEEWLFEGQAHR